MSAPGQRLLADRIPYERLATAVATADSSTFTTTETAVMTTPNISRVTGRTYRISFYGHFHADAAPTNIQVRIRVGSTTGSLLKADFHQIWHTSNGGIPVRISAEWVSPSNASQAFVISCFRTGGAAANIKLDAQSNFPAYAYVEYLEG